MKVARKHIIAAIEAAPRLLFFKRYIIKAYPYKGVKSREFGWKVTVLPNNGE